MTRQTPLPVVLAGLVLAFGGLPALAQTYVGDFNWCQSGGQNAVTSGLASSGTTPIGTPPPGTPNGFGVQASFPSCMVTVYLHGTSNLATLYQSDVGAPPPSLANPFTSAINGSYLFYVVSSTNCYDVVTSKTSAPTVTVWDVCLGASTSGAVSSVFGRTGTVVATTGDYAVAQVTGAAALASPVFTGNPTGPTPATGDNSVSLATTAFVKNQNYVTSGSAPVTSVFGRTGAVIAATNDYTVAQVNGAAPLASPTFTGVPAAPTAAFSTNTTQLATTAFVQAAVTGVSNAVTSVFGRTGAVVAATADYAVAQVTGAAPLASPTFTGTPAAPTPAAGDNSTTLATTAFVKTQGYSTPAAQGTVNSGTTGHCGYYASSSNVISDTGFMCVPQTNATAVTASANVATDQTLMEIALPSAWLNVLAAPYNFYASGIYTIAAAQTPTLTFKIKLCTVSGCGSGTVVTLVSITTTATIALTNNNWNLGVRALTTATGASGTLLAHGAPGLTLDLAASATAADTIFGDTNTASSSAISLTGAVFVDWTVATSVGNAGNTFTQQVGMVSPF